MLFQDVSGIFCSVDLSSYIGACASPVDLSRFRQFKPVTSLTSYRLHIDLTERWLSSYKTDICCKHGKLSWHILVSTVSLCSQPFWHFVAFVAFVVLSSLREASKHLPPLWDLWERDAGAWRDISQNAETPRDNWWNKWMKKLAARKATALVLTPAAMAARQCLLRSRFPLLGFLLVPILYSTCCMCYSAEQFLL